MILDGVGYADTLIQEAIGLEEAGQVHEALVLYERVIDLAEDDEPLADALTRKAGALGTLGRRAASLAVCDELIERFAARPWLASYARYYKAAAAREDAKPHEALALLDELVEDAHEPLLAEALLLKALTLGDLRRAGEALALYDEIAVADERVSVRALAWKIELLNEVARPREAVALARHAIARFDGASDPDVRRHLASVHLQLGLGLEAVRDWPGALAAYEGMLAAFPAGETPDTDAQREWAELRHAALRTMRWVDVHRGWLGAGAAALLIFTVVVGTGRRRDRERRPVAIRLRQGAERGR